jgi:hypothetical protein
MKSKLIVAALLVSLGAISFSFTVSKQPKAKKSIETSQTEPIGGFVSESKF